MVEKFKETFLPTVKAATRFLYTHVLDRRLLPRFGQVAIDQIDACAVRELEASLAKERLQSSTRRNVLTILRSVIRFAVEAKYLPRAPELPKLPRKSKTTALALSRAEVDALLQASPRIEHRLAFALAAFAGLRTGEIRALRWRDVDLLRDEIVVRFAKCRGVTDKPKSGDDRVIPIARELRALLEARGTRPRDEPVALNTLGKQWGQHGMGQAFARMAERAQIEGFHFHCQRHFFITELFEKGVGAPTVQELAGHSRLETAARYAHVRKGSARDAIDRLSGPAPSATPTPSTTPSRDDDEPTK